ncbi:MAG: glycerate kinase [Sulfurospirillaceae bacterium]|nr:glycerate kinase [Sulfurospirillaceae bacterium]MDD2826897.1 glycerate kinase [Sulfurospirillaceae bacterium]
MKVVVAIDSFKGCIGSRALSLCVEEGIRVVYPDVVVEAYEVADGGEGTVQAMVENTHGKIITCHVHDPLMQKIEAAYGILGNGKTAVIEMATAAGLPLVPANLRNPRVTTTYGVGELIKDALARGCREFIVGIGGSATNDAGLGMLQALGFRFFDEAGNDVGLGGDALGKVARIDSTLAMPLLKESHFTVACDVDNPMYGERGAAHIYGKQKGASSEDILILDANVKHFAELLEQQLDKKVAHIAGSGAAGALGGGFLAFLNASLQPGIDMVLDTIHFEECIKDAQFVITGEGKIDAQSAMGKVISGIAKRCVKQKVPLLAFAGHVEESAKALHEDGVTALFSIMHAPISLEEAMCEDKTKVLMKQAVEEVFRVIKVAKGK